jgi:ABC-type phosphate/phosphonate transport system substrate-binding protein
MPKSSVRQALFCGLLAAMLAAGFGCDKKDPKAEEKPTVAGLGADPSKMDATQKQKYDAFMKKLSDSGGKSVTPTPKQ